MDRSKDVIVVEGPIDSMFLPNAIALAGGDNADINRVVSLGVFLEASGSAGV